MTSALRPLFAVCLLTVLSASVDAKAKHQAAVNGALSNLPAFTQTYAFKAGQLKFKSDTEQTALWH